MVGNKLKISEKVLAKAKLIQSKAAFLANDELSGEYRSAFKGRGLEFEEVREYRDGDEIRDIDWKVTARFQKPFVKTFKDEREITIFFLVDISKSTFFSTGERSKAEVIAEITALLSYASLRNKEKTGLIIFSDNVEHYIPPSRGKAHVWKIIRDILDFQPESQKTDINVGLDFLRKVRRKKSVVFLLSDFLSVGFKENLKLISKMHDLRIVSVRDKLERDLTPPISGLYNFRDLETGTQVLVDIKKDKKLKIDLEIKKLADSFGIWFCDLSPTEDYLDKLIKKIKARRN